MDTKIFISYRRDDSAIHAQALYTKLGQHFSEENVFIDVVSIDPGEDFVAALEHAVGECEIVIALIGKKWLTVTDTGGRRRLDDPEDFVRIEIATALRRGVRVVPVLVDGVEMPGADELPEPLRDLSRCNAVALHDKRFLQEVEQLIEALKEALDPDRPATLDEAVTALQRKLRFRRASLFAAACLAMGMFLLGWVGLMDQVLFGLQTRAELLTIRLGDLFAGKPFSDEIALVIIDDETRQTVGAPADDYASWRQHHARVLERLSRAGARVVAFDIYFPSETAADGEFADAITAAREAGTAVILGAGDFEKGEPAIAAELRESASGWGALCVNRLLGYPASVTLAIAKGNKGEAGAAIGSVALQSFAAYHGGDGNNPETIQLNPYAREVQVHLPPASGGTKSFPCFELAWSVRHRQQCAVVAKGDAHATVALDLSPRNRIRRTGVTWKYEDFLGPETEAIGRVLNGKIVFIGEGGVEDQFTVIWRLWPQERRGVELHADALNTLLHGRLIREPGFLTKFALVLGLYFLGAIVRTRLQGRSRHWYTGAFVALCLGYVILAMVCYAHARLLLSLLDGFLAFALSFWAVRTIKRKWFS